MNSNGKGKRYIYRTEGVCPAEIHFELADDTLEQVRFVGGGCPGNAQLVGALLQGRQAGEALDLLKGIACRNGTSCPDQLAKAIESALHGSLSPARSFNVLSDPEPRSRIGLIGDLAGNAGDVDLIAAGMKEKGVEAAYCLGNVTGPRADNAAALKAVRENGLYAIQGELDWRFGQNQEIPGAAALNQKDRDFLVRQPHVRTFELGGGHGLAFHGEYLQRLPGYSDYEPYALEMNMVCGLTRFMEDEEVFPALEAMLPQFTARLIIFGQTRSWGRWTLEQTEFISVGPARDEQGPAWGLLTDAGGGVSFEIVRVK